MAWRLQLTEGTIKRLDILSGRPSLLAAWTRSDQVVFLDLQSGLKKSELKLEPVDLRDRSKESWRQFTETLRAPNNAYLPFVRLKGGGLSLASDGSKKLYYAGGQDLYLDSGGTETPLETLHPSGTEAATHISYVAVGMDRAFGVTAVLDSNADLTLYRERVRIGKFPTRLVITEEFRPILLVTKGSSTVICTDGKSVVAMDSEGKTRSRIALHYTVGAMNCSSDGRRLVISDLDANVVRVYSGSDLRPTHQRYVIDLLAEAKRAQLLTMPEAGRAAVGPLAINSKGVLAFAVDGTLCVTSLARMKSIPKPAV